MGLHVTAANKVFIWGQTDTGAKLFPDVNTGLTYSPGDTFTLRVQLQGAGPTTIRARAWKVSSLEPSAWAVTATSSLGPQVAGSLGIRTHNTTGTTSTISVDGLSAQAI